MTETCRYPLCDHNLCRPRAPGECVCQEQDAEAAIMRVNDAPEPATQYEVRHRYMTDPMFHRLVVIAVGAMEDANGVRFDRHDMALAIDAAGWALLVAERVR